MNSRLVILNLLLLAGCVWLARLVKLDMQKFTAEHHSVPDQVSQSSEAEAKGFSPYQPPKPVDTPAYLHVSTKNLFLASRNLTAPETATEAETAPVLNPKPVLIGVAKNGDRTQAVVRRAPSAPNRRSMVTLQAGDMYEGYKVTKISEKQVELTFTSANGQSINQFINFADPATRTASAPPPPAMTAAAPGQIIQVGDPGAANANPAAAVSQVNAAVAGVDPASGMATANQPAAANPASNTRRNIPMRRSEYIDSQGRRVIRTPWGDIVRPTESSPK